jgi:hypothetical protein
MMLKNRLFCTFALYMQESAFKIINIINPFFQIQRLKEYAENINSGR